MIFDKKTTIFNGINHKITLWEKFLLLFKTTKVDICESEFAITKTKYKILKGKAYIIEIEFKGK